MHQFSYIDIASIVPGEAVFVGVTGIFTGGAVNAYKAQWLVLGWGDKKILTMD